MKITAPTHGIQTGRDGSAAIVAMVLLGALILVGTADFMAARALKSDLKLIEKRQNERINGAPAAPARTNNVTRG